MAFEGNLSAFGLSEILQLVAVQQKSGMLAVTSRDRSSVFYFKDGMITSTRDRRRRNQDPLKDYFIRYGILAREELMRLTNVAAQSKLDLTDVIVAEGVFDEEEMVRHFRNQIQEAVHDVLTWEQCSYKFVPGNEIIEGIRNWGEYQIEGMLMESMRRIDEYPAMLEIFPTTAMSVARAGELEDGVELMTNERTIYALLDRERTLSHLISTARVPKFETYEALRHLHDKGLVKASDTTADTVTDISEEKKRKRGPRRNPLPAIAAASIFLAALAWGTNDVYIRVRHVMTSGSGASERGEVARNRVESKLRWRIESYRALYGTYPPSLQTLTRDNLTSEAFIKRATSLEFRYHLTEDGRDYTLL